MMPELSRFGLVAKVWILLASFFALTLAAVDCCGECSTKPCVLKLRVQRSDAQALQRSINQGHQPWLLDSRAVADDALARVDERYKHGLYVKFLKEVSSSPSIANYEYLLSDGSRRFTVTLRRFDWLLPISKKLESTIWIPTEIEISDMVSVPSR